MMKTHTEMEDFKRLKEFLEDINWKAEIFGTYEETGMAALAASLVLEEDYSIEMIFNYIPMKKDAVEYSRLLHICTPIPIEISTADPNDIMKLLNEFNCLTGVGHFIYKKMLEDETGSISMRHTMAIDMEEPVNEGVVAEILFLMIHYSQMLEGLLFTYLDGEFTMETIIESLQTSRGKEGR